MMALGGSRGTLRFGDGMGWGMCRMRRGWRVIRRIGCFGGAQDHVLIETKGVSCGCVFGDIGWVLVGSLARGAGREEHIWVGDDAGRVL